MNTTIENTTAMSKSQATLWFWAITLTFAGLWLILPSLLHYSYKGDTVELQFIGKEWVLATTNHLMLSAWMLEIVNILTHRAFAAPFIVSAFCTIAMLFSIWQLARNVLSEKLALVATFVMLPYLPFTLKSFLYNPNTALMTFWVLSTLTFYYAFQTNKKRWWIAAGLTLGLGLHAKYTMILLAFTLLSYSLWFPRFRRYWKESGPWLTVLISFTIFVPHLIWLYQMDFATIRYASGAMVERPIVGGWVDHLLCPIIFALGNLGLLLISPILLLIPSLGWRWKRRLPENDTERETLNYLLCCMTIPFLLLAIVVGIQECVRTTYGFPLWFFLGVFLLLQFQRQDSDLSFFRSMKWTSLAVLPFVVIFIIQATLGPHLTNKPSHYHFPMRELGAECDRIWSDRFDSPCPYITGDWGIAGNAAHRMKDRPSVHFYWNVEGPPTSTWSTYEDVNQKGGIILWEASEQVPEWVYRRFPNAEVLPEILELPYKTAAKIPPLRIGIAIVPPPGTIVPHE